MSIIAKYLMKNIFLKPGRTVILLLCIACCSFVAVLGLDVTGNIDKMMKAMLMQATGTADMIVSDPVGVDGEFDLPYENDQVLVYSTKGGLIRENSEFYSYYHRVDYKIETMDFGKAYRMLLLPQQLEIKDGEAVISRKLAKETGWSVGDEVTLYDKYKQEKAFRVAGVLPNEGLANNQLVLFVNMEEFGCLVSDMRANTIYADILDDGEAEDAKRYLEDADFNASVMLVSEQSLVREMVGTLTEIFIMIFSLCLLLVIFVAISVSTRIVSERFSVIGTFRSLGVSSAFCTGLLFAENALYGLLGGLLGVLPYIAVRDALFGSIFKVQSDALELHMVIPPFHFWAVVLVLLLCILIMCACPLKEIIATAKTPIRDIIFDNKDTAYRMKKSMLVCGLACVLGAIATFLLKGNTYAQIASFVLLIVAVSLCFPWVLKLLSEGIGTLFEKWGHPVAHLASKECYSRKSTVGSAGLCVTASALAIVIFIFVSTLSSVYDLHAYDCDLIVTVNPRQEVSRFSYIKELDGVTDTEIIYGGEQLAMKINGKKQDLVPFGLNDGGYRLMTAIKDCPDHLEKDTFAIDRKIAKKHGLEVGDMVEVTFSADSYIPVSKTLRLAAIVDSYEYQTTSDSIILPMNLYTDMYQNYPNQVLVRCSEPAKVSAEINKYSSATIGDITTKEEREQYWKGQGAGMKKMLYAIIIVGVGMTLVGMVSNQLIGFQGRRRECAGLISTAMTVSDVMKMFLTESMISNGIALLLAFPAALAAFQPFKNVIESLGDEIGVVYDFKLYFLFLLVLWAVFTLVALFPIKELRRMNLAENLKYE